MPYREDPYISMARREARRWVTLKKRHPYTKFYLYYKPTRRGRKGDIRVAQRSPGPGWHLSPEWPEPLENLVEGILTYEKAARILSREAAGLPIL